MVHSRLGDGRMRYGPEVEEPGSGRGLADWPTVAEIARSLAARRTLAPIRRVLGRVAPPGQSIPTSESTPYSKNARVSATACASPTRSTTTPGGKAVSNRLGVWRSSNRNTPRSVALRISRPNAWRSRNRTMRSS